VTQHFIECSLSRRAPTETFTLHYATVVSVTNYDVIGALQVSISKFEPDQYLPYEQLQRNIETIKRR